MAGRYPGGRYDADAQQAALLQQQMQELHNLANARGRAAPGAPVKPAPSPSARRSAAWMEQAEDAEIIPKLLEHKEQVT